jgi:hypothetical protein
LSTWVLIATASKLLRFVKKVRSPIKPVDALPKAGVDNKSPDPPFIQTPAVYAKSADTIRAVISKLSNYYHWS